MALRFIDGFDYYPVADILQRWTTASNHSLTSGTTRFGTGQALSLFGGASVFKVIDAQVTWILGGAVRVPGVSPAGSLVQFRSGPNIVARLDLSTAGNLSIVSQNTSGGSIVHATGTTGLVANVWYYIEFKYTCAASTGLVAAGCRLNGITEMTVTPTSGGSTTNGTSVDTFALLTPTTAGYFWDDLYLCDGTGATNNDFLGDVRVETLRPNGAGYLTNFGHTGAATNWQAVSDVTENGDTSYVSSAGVGDIDSYTMSDLSSTPQGIFGVQAVMVARKDDAGSRSVKQLTRIAGTDYLGPDVSLQDSYKLHTRIMETSPATSAAWTASEVNAIEMGIKLVS